MLAAQGAQYRFGAPLDVRWMSGGWSAHLEHASAVGLRLRTDFVTRPPRLSDVQVAALWTARPESEAVPVVGLEELAELKKTNREKDFAVIGELARLMPNPRSQIRYSRSARDLLELAEAHPTLITEEQRGRPTLAAIAEGRQRLEQELDAERRQLMHANERRLERYQHGAEAWRAAWPSSPLQKAVRGETERFWSKSRSETGGELGIRRGFATKSFGQKRPSQQDGVLQRAASVRKELTKLPLLEAHELIVERALPVLPFYPDEES